MPLEFSVAASCPVAAEGGKIDHDVRAALGSRQNVMQALVGQTAVDAAGVRELLADVGPFQLGRPDPT